MRIRVEHFSGDYFVVKYSLHWYSPENTVEEGDLNFSSPSLITRAGRPVLFKFSDAEQFAKSATKESLIAYQEKLTADYDDAMAKAYAKLASNAAKEFSIKK